MLRIVLATVHLLAFATAISAVLSRGAALRLPVSADSLRRAFRADNFWGLAALVLGGTGLWRYLGGIEKSTAYYNRDLFFLSKMKLFALIFIVEVWPMITLIRWRRAIRHGATAESVALPRVARQISTISFVEAFLIMLMVVAATAMARGFGLR